jgi:hypothetical protein
MRRTPTQETISYRLTFTQVELKALFTIADDGLSALAQEIMSGRDWSVIDVYFRDPQGLKAAQRAMTKIQKALSRCK